MVFLLHFLHHFLFALLAYLELYVLHFMEEHKIWSQGGWEMVPRLRTLTALPEDPGSVPSTHISQLTSTCNYRSWGPNILFCPPQTHALTMHRPIHANKAKIRTSL